MHSERWSPSTRRKSPLTTHPSRWIQHHDWHKLRDVAWWTIRTKDAILNKDQGLDYFHHHPFGWLECFQILTHCQCSCHVENDRFRQLCSSSTLLIPVSNPLLQDEEDFEGGGDVVGSIVDFSAMSATPLPSASVGWLHKLGWSTRLTQQTFITN